MKKLSKVLSLILCLALMLSLFAPASLAEETCKIAIGQFAEHPSLDNCREGFLMGLAEQGFIEGENLEIAYQNAQTDMGTAALIASNFAANQYDLLCGIATPMAVCMYNAADEETPCIYIAVSAPVESGLADENGLGTGNVTGSSDLIPVAMQLELIRTLLPDAQKIGILYTIGETNSLVQLKEYEALAPEYGFEIVSSGIATGADIDMAVAALAPQVDCLNMLTDNTVVQYLDVVLDETDALQKPVFGSEVEQVKRGCIAAQGLDYIELGRQTGLYAARVLKGEYAGDLPFIPVTESKTYYNPAVCESLGILLPDTVAASAIDATLE